MAHNYVSKSVQPRLFKVGANVAWLLALIECTAIQTVEIVGGILSITGTKKTVYPWSDALEQFCIWMTDADGNSHVHRFNKQGVLKAEDNEYTQAMRESGRYTVVSYKGHNYVCETVNGKTVRVENVNKTAVCTEIICHFLSAIVSGAENVPMNTAVDNAIAGKTKFIVKMVADTWADPDDGVVHDQLVVSSKKDSFSVYDENKPEKKSGDSGLES